MSCALYSTGAFCLVQHRPASASPSVRLALAVVGIDHGRRLKARTGRRPSASEAAREPGSDALKCVPPGVRKRRIGARVAAHEAARAPGPSRLPEFGLGSISVGGDDEQSGILGGGMCREGLGIIGDGGDES